MQYKFLFGISHFCLYYHFSFPHGFTKTARTHFKRFGCDIFPPALQHQLLKQRVVYLFPRGKQKNRKCSHSYDLTHTCCTQFLEVRCSCDNVNKRTRVFSYKCLDFCLSEIKTLKTSIAYKSAFLMQLKATHFDPHVKYTNVM